MYIPKAVGSTTLEFRGDWKTWGLWGLTLISTLLALVYLFFAKPINFVFSKIARKLKIALEKKFDRKLKNWIEDE